MIIPILLFVGTLLLSLWAASRVKSVYQRYSEFPAASGESGAQVAAQILDLAGIHDVEIVPHDEYLGDHYDPASKRLVLSRQNYYGTSCAALGVAAHECGHAIQHKHAYAPLQWRMAAVGVTTYANQVVTWLPLLGMVTGILQPFTGALIMSCAWGVIMLFNLVTLPVEFDASTRAKALLSNLGHVATPDQMGAVRKVLDAAAWTYVAAFITSLAYLLWHILPFFIGRRDEE